GSSSTWPPVADYAASGPFVTTRDVNTGPDGSFDVLRPAELGAMGHKHPIISWANGTLFALDEYVPLLSHWASHGFVVIASHSNSTAGGVTHQVGIEWLKAQNDAAQSAYFGKLDTTRIGAAGHSQGGGATIAAGAGEPKPVGIVTTLPLMPIANFEKDLTILGRQLVPMFNIVATMDNRDPAFAARLFDQANGELVQAAFIGVHEDAMNPAMKAPTLAWFRLRLMDDAQACGWFYPADSCRLCLDTTWQAVKYKP
ncbi:MAG TPA: acetylxylan esterase, partial [Polyangiaceae bacterium]|nr:acetylxylan esterase [Polyangiaceae bacterium]